jgi:hypothetical protein
MSDIVRRMLLGAGSWRDAFRKVALVAFIFSILLGLIRTWSAINYTLSYQSHGGDWWRAWPWVLFGFAFRAILATFLFAL